MTLWLATIVLNLILCFLLLFGGHYRRYPWLLLSLIWQVMAAPVLHHIYTTSGTHSTAYLQAWTFKNFLDVGMTLGVAAEGFYRKNRWIEASASFLSLLLIVILIGRSHGGFEISHILHEILRWSNMIVLTLWVYLFRSEANNGQGTRTPRT